MAKNRKNQSASIRFGPALRALCLCLLIAGSAVGYVWQKGQVFQLGKQIDEKEKRLALLKRDNQTLERQIDDLSSKVQLELSARRLGLEPRRPEQVVHLSESPSGLPDNADSSRKFAGRPVGTLAHETQ